MSSAHEKSPDDILLSGKRALTTEIAGMQALLSALGGDLGQNFAKAVALMAHAKGRVILSGMGKSGIVARKISATFASTGTPAFYVHPAEASHGDLGMITSDDVLLLLSNSGESLELRDILLYAQRFVVPLIAITTGCLSALAKKSQILLLLPQAAEACPIGKAPTTSTLLQLALGDMLAVALMEAKNFTEKDFHNFHPGGKLGAQLAHIAEFMHIKGKLPLAQPTMTMPEALIEMTQYSLGCLGVLGPEGALIGIITDGDLRRHMGPEFLTLTAGQIMTPNPQTIGPQALAIEALHILNARKITSLFVVDQDDRPIGLIHIHDLLRLGIA